MNTQPYQEMQLPISVKGVVLQQNRVVLLKNERDEWELPGGKLEKGEKPESCVAREIMEETGWQVTVGPLLNAWVYNILPGRTAFVISYGCQTDSLEPPKKSREHKEISIFEINDIESLNMPAEYKVAINLWWKMST